MKKPTLLISFSKYFLIVIGTLLLSAGIIAGEDSTYYYSSTGNNVNSIMYTEVNWQGCTSANLMFDTKYDIGPGDHAYLFGSDDRVHLSIIWDCTGTKSDWTPKSLILKDLTNYVKYKYIGFWYKTDSSGFGDGFCVDDIHLYSPDLDRTLLYDNGENGPGLWDLEDGFTFIDISGLRLEGDVTNTGLPITGADAQLVAQHIIHISTLTDENAQAADVNDNQGGITPHITGADLQLIKQYIVHTISEFPGGEYIP